jgi:hypothetical protein
MDPLKPMSCPPEILSGAVAPLETVTGLLRVMLWEGLRTPFDWKVTVPLPKAPGLLMETTPA